MQKLSVDCEWSRFGNWSSCSKSCGVGIKTRKRHKIKMAFHGGKECHGKYEKVAQCNQQDCPRKIYKIIDF